MVGIWGNAFTLAGFKTYSTYRNNDFVVYLRYKWNVIKEYFENFFLNHSDVSIDIKNNKLEVDNKFTEDWKIILV